MEIIYIFNTIAGGIAVSLGVGCSTVAIAQFFVAISDGKIDEAERKMMEVVYTILRVAMGLILVTTVIQAGIIYKFIGLEYISPFSVGVWVVLAVLFINAFAMTKHWIPSTFGPGIQAGSWYTLGIMMSLISVGFTGFSYLQFGLAYGGMLLLAIAVVNAVMNYLKEHKV